MIKTSYPFKVEVPPEKGERGAMARGPSPFDSTVGTIYLSGAASELYYDLRFYRGVLYRCKLSYIVSSSSATPLSDTTHWEVFAVQEYTATKTQFIGGENGGWLIDNGVIQYVEPDGTVRTTLNRDGSMVAGDGNYQVDKYGVMNAFAGIFSGYLQMPFKSITEAGTSYNSSTDKYTINTNLNLICYASGHEMGYIYINIPVGSARQGQIINLWMPPMLSRMDPGYTLHIADHQNRFMDSTELDSDDYASPFKQFNTNGGFLQLVGIPSGTSVEWIITIKHLSSFSSIVR